MTNSRPNIRNFVIISHIDHGKSTLADRFLELTKTISKEKMKPQYLDMMDLERERGITIKMQPVRMLLELAQNQKDSLISAAKIKTKKENKEFYILNLIDTPGHVDFSYEVSRSLAAVEGAILLVDATKGIQAQTLANLDLARKENLTILPVVNKIDLPQAKIKETTKDLANLLKVKEDEVIKISAKYGINVEQVLEAVIKKIPGPSFSSDPILKALIFDSKYDPYRGVIAYVRIMTGEVKKGQDIYLVSSKTQSKVKEVGYFKPELTEKEKLIAGEIGYIATGIKEPERVRVGDTIIESKFKNQNSKLIRQIKPWPGYQEPKPMIFSSFYPENPADFDLLKRALTKLKLNDAALIFEPEQKLILGRGFRCGFLGSLHAEIISERLRREFNLNLIVSLPQVSYKVIDRQGREIFIQSLSDWPDQSQVKIVEEPWVKLEVITPSDYLGRVIEILEGLKGKHLQTQIFAGQRYLLVYEVPLREIIVGFYDKLKGSTQGFASMNYQFLEYRPADLVKLDILILGKREEAFSKIVPRDKAYLEGKKIIKKLKQILPPQLFSVPLQAAVRGKIIARETIKAKGKDVLAPLYGGDFTRKKKLLEKQKRGKKRLKEMGRIKIPPRVFLEMFKSS